MFNKAWKEWSNICNLINYHIYNKEKAAKKLQMKEEQKDFNLVYSNMFQDDINNILLGQDNDK